MVISPWIEVVMPTYNGVRFLEEQVASIYTQTLQPKRLIIRDDGSSDGTQFLLEQLAKKYDKWLYLLPFGENLG